MRTAFRSARLVGSLALCLSLAACSQDAVDDDDDPTPGGSDAGGELPAPETGFQIVTPELEIAPGQEVTYCYYTTIPIEQTAGVKRWESRMTPGSHHLILYFLPSLSQPEGTLTQDCEVFGGAGAGAPIWTYSSQTPEAVMALPDGVGMDIEAGQPAVIQMHYLNAGDTTLRAHVTINGVTFEPGAIYEKAAPYVTYNTQIDIPAGGTGFVQGTCAVPDGAKFFLMSSHSHQFSTLTRVTDASEMVVESNNWEHPTVATWYEDPFFEFASGALTYRCEYLNTSSARVRTGDSAKTDEMCMASGYFFPAEGPVFCLNSFVVPF
jgi:hypothetical protein